jgi:hypothetical protein
MGSDADMVASCDWWDCHGVDCVPLNQRNLYAAVLVNNLADLRRGILLEKPQQSCRFREALKWVLHGAWPEGRITFEDVCNALGFNVDALRRAMRSRFPELFLEGDDRDEDVEIPSVYVRRGAVRTTAWG